MINYQDVKLPENHRMTGLKSDFKISDRTILSLTIICILKSEQRKSKFLYHEVDNDQYIESE